MSQSSSRRPLRLLNQFRYLRLVDSKVHLKHAAYPSHTGGAQVFPPFGVTFLVKQSRQHGLRIPAIDTHLHQHGESSRAFLVGDLTIDDLVRLVSVPA